MKIKERYIRNFVTYQFIKIINVSINPIKDNYINKNDMNFNYQNIDPVLHILHTCKLSIHSKLHMVNAI